MRGVAGSQFKNTHAKIARRKEIRRARGGDLPWPVVGAEDVPPRGFALLLVGGRQVVLGDATIVAVDGGDGGDGVRVGAADGDDDALAAAPLELVVPRLAPLGLHLLQFVEGRAGHGPGALPTAHVVLGRRGGRHEIVGKTLHHFITGARRRCN